MEPPKRFPATLKTIPILRRPLKPINSITVEKRFPNVSNHDFKDAQHLENRNPIDDVLSKARQVSCMAKDLPLKQLEKSAVQARLTENKCAVPVGNTRPVVGINPAPIILTGENLPGSCDDNELSDDFEQPKSKITSSKTPHPCPLVTQQTKKPTCRKKPNDIAATISKMRQDSISNEHFQKVHDFMPSLMADYIVTECVKGSYDDDWKGSIRVNINSRTEAEEWLRSFEKISKCDFRFKKSKKENSDRLVFKREYRCHHNTRPRKKASCDLEDDSEPAANQHSSRRISKNTGCPAIIRITIKQKSMTWSSDDLLQDFPCEIFIKHTHNHRINAADVLRHRRPSKELREKFLKMFAAGHSPKSAIENHKFDLLLEHGDKYIFAAADGSISPSNFWVYKLFSKVSSNCYGPQTGDEMLDALRKLCSKYNDDVGEECCKVDLHEGRDLVVAVCTPIMKRTHTLLRSAGEMVFVDSSGTMDALNCRVFLFLTPSVAGALPLGILLVTSESKEVLKHGLNLLKSLMPPNAFYGRGPDVGPKLGMTDDCTSERDALWESFPGLILLLLCIFHVLQAFWRYVWKRDHNVPPDDRTELFFLFKDVVYASDLETFEDRIQDLKNNSKMVSNPIVLNHVLDFLKRSSEWALCHRVDLLTRGHDTNNYSEATMRIIKDIILGRIKAFNPVQLLDFLLTRFVSYIEMRIIDVLNNRSLHPFKSRYFIDPVKMADLKSEKLPFPPDCYKVKNLTKGTEYTIVMSCEVCSCPVGSNGKPCKHLCCVVRDFNLSSQQVLPRFQNGQEMKMILFEIVHGHRDVPQGWFDGLFESRATTENDASDSYDHSLTTDITAIDPATLEDVTSHCEDLRPNLDEEISLAKDKLQEMVSGWIGNLEKRPDIFLKACQSIVDVNKKISNSDSALVSAMFSFGKGMGAAPLSVKKATGNTIPVLSTARRKVYLGGRKALSGGRPPKGVSNSLVPEHSYSVNKGNKTVAGPSWNKLPERKRPAPHALQDCVLTKRMIGGTHSKK